MKEDSAPSVLQPPPDRTMVEVSPFTHFGEPICYETFELYLQSNTPCTFGSWFSVDWPARHSWVQEDGSPNFCFLTEQFGDCKASVSQFNGRLETECFEKTIGEFISYWKNLSGGRDKCVKDFPEDNFTSLPHYLKDWHFAKSVPAESVYRLPNLFSDDWLNKYWKNRDDVSDDYIFSYLGPVGSYTPFHADVFRSYSWSVNVCGCKKWLILYPGEELKLSDPGLNIEKQCREKELKYHLVLQGPGEGIFVPSGWWHQVLNAADTISINHNWANFHCVPKMWKYLTSELMLVEREISDCRDLMSDREWYEQCQLVLRANIGIDFTEFFQFILINLKYLSLETFNRLVNDLPNISHPLKVLDLPKAIEISDYNVKPVSQLYTLDDVIILATSIYSLIKSGNC